MKKRNWPREQKQCSFCSIQPKITTSFNKLPQNLSQKTSEIPTDNQSSSTPRTTATFNKNIISNLVKHCNFYCSAALRSRTEPQKKEGCSLMIRKIRINVGWKLLGWVFLVHCATSLNFKYMHLLEEVSPHVTNYTATSFKQVESREVNVHIHHRHRRTYVMQWTVLETSGSKGNF